MSRNRIFGLAIEVLTCINMLVWPAPEQMVKVNGYWRLAATN